MLVLPCGTVPCNKHIVELADLTKPHIRQLVEDTNLVSVEEMFRYLECFFLNYMFSSSDSLVMILEDKGLLSF